MDAFLPFQVRVAPWEVSPFVSESLLQHHCKHIFNDPL